MLRAATLALGMLLAGPAAAETLLRLSASAEVMVLPDQLSAVLRAEAESATAADAQAQVNKTMAAAVTLARQTAGVGISTGAYTVWPQSTSIDASHPPGRQTWRASQTLTLKSGDGVALLTLVGTLQGHGMATSQLGWQVADATARKARDEAMKQALGKLRAGAEEAAGILGLHFDSFREVRLGAVHQQPMPMLGAAMASPMSRQAPPPTAEIEEVPIRADVEADAVLK